MSRSSSDTIFANDTSWSTCDIIKVHNRKLSLSVCSPGSRSSLSPRLAPPHRAQNPLAETRREDPLLLQQRYVMQELFVQKQNKQLQQKHLSSLQLQHLHHIDGDDDVSSIGISPSARSLIQAAIQRGCLQESSRLQLQVEFCKALRPSMTLRGSSKNYSDKYSELVNAINEISQATVKEEGPFLNGAFSVLRFCSVCEKGCNSKGCNPSGVDKLSAHSGPARLGAFEVELIWENAGERERLEIFSKLGCGLFPCVKLLVDNLVHALPLLEPANGIHALLGQKAAYMQEMISREQELRQLRYELAALRQQQEKSIEEHKGVVFEMEILKKSLSTAQQRVMEVEAELMTSQQQYKVLQDVGIKEMEVYDGRFADLNAAIAKEKQVEKREREREREKAERELNQERGGRQTDKKAAEREIEKGRELVVVLRQQVASVECKLSLASGALVSIKEELQLERARLQETTLQKAKAELDVKVGALLGEELKKEKERVAVLQRRVDELEDKVRGLEEEASDWERVRESIQGEAERVQEELKKELRKKEREVEKGKDRWTTLQLRVDELEEQARDWERERMRIQGEMERVRVSIQGEGERVQEELKEELRKKEREVEKGKDRCTILQLRVDELEEQARDWERERMRIQGEMERVQKELKTSLCQKETAPLPASSKPKVLLAPLPASSSKPRVISVAELEEELLQVEKCARENLTRETQRVSALEDELRKKREWVGVVQEFIQEVDIVRDEVKEVDGGINGMLEEIFERERSRPAQEQERAGELIQRLKDEHAEKDSVQSAKCKSERELQEEMSRQQEELTQLKNLVGGRGHGTDKNISTRSLRATTVKTRVLLPMPPPTPPTLSQHKERYEDWCVTRAHDDLHERLRGYEKRLTQAINACSDLEESAVHYLNSTSIDFSTNMISPLPAEGSKEGAEMPRIGEHEHDRHIKVLMASRFGTQPSGDPQQTNSRVSCTPSSRIMSPDQVLSELRTQESAPVGHHPSMSRCLPGSEPIQSLPSKFVNVGQRPSTASSAIYLSLHCTQEGGDGGRGVGASLPHTISLLPTCSPATYPQTEEGCGQRGNVGLFPNVPNSIHKPISQPLG